MADALDKLLISLGLKEEPPSNASIALTGAGLVGSVASMPDAFDDTLGLASRRVLGDAMTAVGPTGLNSSTFNLGEGAEVHRGRLVPALLTRLKDDPTAVNKGVYMPRAVLDAHMDTSPLANGKRLAPGWTIPSKYIPGSDDFSRLGVIREAVEAFPEYARNNKTRVGLGALSGALGAAGIVSGASSLADKLEKRSQDARVRKLLQGK